MERADADIALYQEVYDRIAKLIRSGGASQQNLDEAKRNLDSSSKAREAAQAN